MSTTRILVWDIPTRLFHWLLTAGFIACFGFAQLAEEHSFGFAIHMLLGIVLGALVAWRIMWGIIGSRYARFGSFLYSPASLIGYIQGAFTTQSKAYVGHNPGSSYAIFAMLFLLGTTVATGLLMSGGNEASEELHAASSYALAAVVGVHIVGVIWYSVRHRENITGSMVTGTKVGEPADAISSSRPLAALILAVLVGVLTMALFRGYDQASGEIRLPFLNTVIFRGESGSNGDED